MSIHGVQAAILTDAPTASAKAVMVALGYCHNHETGLCHPSRGRLAKLSGLKARTIYDAIKALEDSDPPLIRRFERRRASDGMRTSDGFELLFATPDALRDRLIEDAADAAANLADEDPEGSVADFADQGEKVSGGFRQTDRGSVAPAAKELAAGATQERGRKEEESLGPQGGLAESADVHLDVLAAKIWAVVPPMAQQRSKDDPRKVEFALRDAKLEGQDLGEVVPGVIAYYQHPDRTKEGGRYAGAPHLVIEDQRWRKMSDDVRPRRGESKPTPPPPAENVAAVVWEGESYARPPGTTSDPLGTTTDPGPARQLRWLADWFGRSAATRAMFWPEHERGPAPGEPGCRCWPSVLAVFEEATDA